MMFDNSKAEILSIEDNIVSLVAALGRSKNLSAEQIARKTIEMYRVASTGEAHAAATSIEQDEQVIDTRNTPSILLTERPAPAVPVEESVQPDGIICLENGKKFKMLKRHLRETYGITPEQYRKRWDLPDDYPMTAPEYSQRKRREAIRAGLGCHERA